MIDGLVDLTLETIKPPQGDINIKGDRLGRFGVIRSPAKLRATVTFEWYDDGPPPADVMRYRKAISG